MVYSISYDKSNEDIPVLTVARNDNWIYGSPNLSIVNIITGNRATELWNELTGKNKVESYNTRTELLQNAEVKDATMKYVKSSIDRGAKASAYLHENW